jgi:hypothetical protein
MHVTNGRGEIDHAAIAQGAAAERLSATVVVAFDACEDAGIALTELQKIAILHALLLQFDGFADHVRSLEAVDRLLWNLGHLP